MFCIIHRKTPVLLTFFNEKYRSHKKETPTQMFSYEYCEMFKNGFFTEHLLWVFLRLINWNITSALQVTISNLSS